MPVKNTTAIKGMCIAAAAWYPVVNKGINLAVLQRTALASLLFIFVSLVHFFSSVKYMLPGWGWKQREEAAPFITI